MRRTLGMLTTTMVLVIPLVLAGCQGEPPPNIVLVVLDTVRDDHTGLGAERADSRTPTLDGLAAGATVFTHAFANAPWTPPSHASMFTGLLPSGHGCTHRYPQLDPQLPTVARLLGEAGWETGAFSSNPWLSVRTTGLCRDFGFHRESPPRGGLQGDVGTWSGDQGGRGTNYQFYKWLENREDDAPFFAFLNFLEAHDPYDPAPAVRAEFLRGLPADATVDSDWIVDHQAGLHADGSVDWSRVGALYGGDVRTADAFLAGVVGNLQRFGAWENTVLIVTSDHGENLGEHDLVSHQFSVHESLLAVPLVIRAPGILPAGRRDDPVMLSDLFRTILDLAGVPAPTPTPFSRSLLEAPAPADRPLVAEYGRPSRNLLDVLQGLNPGVDRDRLDRGLRTVRLGDLRLTVADGGERLLHDMGADPGQVRDLAADRPRDANALTALLERLLAGAEMREGDVTIDEATREQLRSLGYVH
jgi:arylsulfatase A-like enzyme